MNHSLFLEMRAFESVDGNPLDPDRDVPFAVLYETHETLDRVCRPEVP